MATLGNIISGFIVILVGVTLMPTVADETYSAQYASNGYGNDSNVTGASATIVGLTTLFFALGIMSAGVAITVSGLRNAGMI